MPADNTAPAITIKFQDRIFKQDQQSNAYWQHNKNQCFTVELLYNKLRASQILDFMYKALLNNILITKKTQR